MAWSVFSFANLYTDIVKGTYMVKVVSSVTPQMERKNIVKDGFSGSQGKWGLFKFVQ